MTILIFLIVSYILLSIALYLVFPKMGIDSWKGLVPVLNFLEWCEAIGRPKWWVALLFLPIVNLFIFVGMAVDLARSFKKYSFWHSAISVIYAPAMIAYLGLNAKEKYEGPTLIKEKEYQDAIEEAKSNKDQKKLKKLSDSNPYKKSPLREWVESIVFAVFAAAFIRMFLIEAYVIPTPSMEGSLLVGDFLFVSKAAYGIRTPMTVAMVPLLHNRIPGLGVESYFKKPSLPYFRLKPLSKIKRNSPLVFNWPVGDSVYITSRRSYTVNQVMRDPAFLNYDRELVEKVEEKDFVVRPVDKKDHYIKRCVAIPGDTLQIIDRQLYINGSPAENPEHMQMQYLVRLPGTGINPRRLSEWGIDNSDYWANAMGQGGYFLDGKQVDLLQDLDPNVRVTPANHPPEPEKLFPHDPENFPDWSVDNYGPVWLPKKGVTIDINKQNIALYQRIIGVYEQNILELKGDEIIINGEVATRYTFSQDYYWAMGDNRHNSEDSRAWGFVPHDHVVGKPLFIWFSTKNGSISNGINWNRIFKSANVK